MSKPADHIAFANRCQKTLDYLLLEHNQFSEWIATVAFYKAIHIAEAMFAAKEPNATKHSIDHKSRNQLLQRGYGDFYKHFLHLWTASNIARYLCFDGKEFESFAKHLSPDEVVEKLVRKRLAAAEAYACKKLPTSIAGILHRVEPLPPPDAPVPPA